SRQASDTDRSNPIDFAHFNQRSGSELRFVGFRPPTKKVIDEFGRNILDIGMGDRSDVAAEIENVNVPGFMKIRKIMQMGSAGNDERRAQCCRFGFGNQESAGWGRRTVDPRVMSKIGSGASPNPIDSV